MLALIIIGGVLLLLGLLLLVPVGFRAAYDAGGLVLQWKVACFRFRIYPEREKRDKPPKRKKKDQAQEAKASEEEQGKPKKQLGDLKWLLELIEPGLKALGQLRRKLKIELMRVEYSIGGASDPAEAAIKYGIVSAGGGALFPLINSAFDVRDWDVELGVDFEQQESRVALEAQGTWRLGTLIRILFSLGICALQAYRNHQSKPVAKTANHKEEVKNGRKASDR